MLASCRLTDLETGLHKGAVFLMRRKVDWNKKKDGQLGMSYGTANYRLQRTILFHLIQMAGLDYCFQCGQRIESIKELSVEHKVPWLDSQQPRELFFNIDNIAFSHRKCNYAAKRNEKPEMTTLLCSRCGEEFETRVCFVKGHQKSRRQQNFYCSQECAGNKKKDTPL